jgi:glycosyltransferase involved in cell wall biosynthesis
VWTLHDCWAFTGRCSHFEQADCFQWKTGCKKCPNMSVYPISYFFDFSKKMWIDKKNHFCGVRKMTLVTPSQWLADYVKTSFLSEYPVKIINNGINLDIYKPNHRISNFYNEISNKKIILGVATSWSKMKGLEDFIKLDKIIDHEKYIIILVGLNSNQIKLLPDSIISVTKTKNEKELVKYYSSADVFVNLTYQDNYPTTNLEAISCGLPVITYDTGGSPESVTEKTGVIVEQGNLEKIYYAIKDICEGKRNINREDLFEHAKTNFDKNQIFLKYLELYNSLREI